MKIRLMVLALIFVCGLSGSDKDCNTLGVFPFASGKPLITVTYWNKEVNILEEVIKCRFIQEKKFGTGRDVYLIMQSGEQARLNTFVFDEKDKQYRCEGAWDACGAESLRNLSLDNCAYIVCIPENLDFIFLHNCASIINRANSKWIATAIHCPNVSEKDEIVSTLVGDKRIYKQFHSNIDYWNDFLFDVGAALFMFVGGATMIFFFIMGKFRYNK